MRYSLLIALAVTVHTAQAQRVNATCYRMHYAPDDGSLPVLIALAPGKDSGRVDSKADSEDTDDWWRMFQNAHARWVRSNGDSLQLQFDNGFTFILFELENRSDSLLGTATIHYDFGDPKRYPHFAVSASKTRCPHR